MTREEAIRILDPETTGEAIAEIEYYGGFNGKTAAVQAVSDACVLAVAALREQEERENTKPLTLEIQNLDLRKIVLRALLSVEYQYTQTHSLMTGNVADYICQSIEKSIAKNERNDPLTLDDLRKMDWEPVWCLCKPIDGGNGFWCICKKGTIIPPSGVRFDVKEIPHWVFLRNKPKEEA